MTMKSSPVGLQLTAWTGWPSWGSNSLRREKGPSAIWERGEDWMCGNGQGVLCGTLSRLGKPHLRAHNVTPLWPPSCLRTCPHLNGLMSDFIPLKSYIRTM